MVQAELDQIVQEVSDRRSVFVNCKQCANQLTWFMFLGKYNRHFWKLDFNDVFCETKGDLELGTDGNVLCICKRLIGILLDEYTILVKKTAIVIDY